MNVVFWPLLAEEGAKLPEFKGRNPSALFSSLVTETHRPREMSKMKMMGPKVQKSHGAGKEGKKIP